mmetsp:Transcript_1053/g.1029  ORF Transcript_1053/g.1029 Transcript_1053/m.1029 type:complete len:117 (-) Transcript_1053:124-474(-)
MTSNKELIYVFIDDVVISLNQDNISPVGLISDEITLMHQTILTKEELTKTFEKMTSVLHHFEAKFSNMALAKDHEDKQPLNHAEETDSPVSHQEKKQLSKKESRRQDSVQKRCMIK